MASEPALGLPSVEFQTAVAPSVVGVWRSIFQPSMSLSKVQPVSVTTAGLGHADPVGAVDSVLGTTMATDCAGNEILNSLAVVVVTEVAPCGCAALLYVSWAAVLRM